MGRGLGLGNIFKPSNRPGSWSWSEWTVSRFPCASPSGKAEGSADTFAKTLALMTYLQSLFALQLLTLARCHPCICIVATTICTSLGCSCWQRLVFSEDQEHNIFVELRRRPYMEYCFLYVLVLASHLLDTWQKRQANHDEGLELGQLESTQTINEESPDTQARS